VNFVTAHDGYTLRDLVSYEQKHNEANGEGNRDGHDDNLSRNWGVEGETDDPAILEKRRRAMRNLLASLALSQGVPMISHGDEIGRTQRGNNNAYAQDNAISWVDWALEPWQEEMLEFTRRVLAIRHTNPVLRRRSFFRGRPVGGEGVKDLTWLRPDGREMGDGDWHRGDTQVLGMLLSGEAADETDERGRPVKGDTMLLLLNGGFEAATFRLPALDADGGWVKMVDTAQPMIDVPAGAEVEVPGFSLALLRFGTDRRLASSLVSVESAVEVNTAAVSSAATGTMLAVARAG
jgi:glycogen operon protein